jgi:multisubunit Na+/H+ antiporter MnhE subunit
MWRGHAPAAVVLWIAFAAIEALLVGKIDPQETPVGIAIAALAALATVGSLAAAGVRYAVPVAEIVHLPALVWNVVRDTIVVTGALLRALAGKPPEDRLQRIPFDPGGDDAVSAARRALVVAGTSASPNSVVIDADAEHGVLIVHRLAR